MLLAMRHPDWVLGFEDETWFSRFAHPNMYAWANDTDKPLRLVEQTPRRDDPEPKALACYGLLVRSPFSGERIFLRFVDGRPVSAITIEYLSWCCQKLEAEGKKALLLVWDNAGWHVSHLVSDWIRNHNRDVKRCGKGVRIIACPLPSKSPWLNPIEPKWIHGKRRADEATRTLTAQELEGRIYEVFNCLPEPHLSVPEKVV